MPTGCEGKTVVEFALWKMRAFMYFCKAIRFSVILFHKPLPSNNTLSVYSVPWF